MLQGSAWLSMHGMRSICQTYAKHMPSLFQAYSKHMPSLFQAYSEHMPSLFREYPKHRPSLLQAYTIFNRCIFQTYAQLIPIILQAYAQPTASMFQYAGLPGTSCDRHGHEQELFPGSDFNILLFAFWFDYQDLLNQVCIPVGLSMRASNSRHLETHFGKTYCGINLVRFECRVF